MAGAYPTQVARRHARWRKGTVVELLRLGRCQTAALTVPVALIPYWLARGTFDAQAWLWVAWAVAVHYAALASNNLMDLPYDRQDPHKQMFPLVNGAMSERTAWRANLVAHVPAVLIPIAIAPTPIVVGWLLAGLAGGWAYCLESKMHPWAIAWNHVFMAAIVVVPFVAYAPTPTPALLAWLAITQLILLYHLLVEGPLKDAGSRQMPYDWRKLSTPTKLAIGLGCRAASIAASAWLLLSVKPDPGLVDWAPVAAWAVITVLVALPLLLQPRDLRIFGVNEVAVYTLGLVALVPVMGAAWAVALVLGPLAWYMAYNRAAWGSWTAPQV